MINRNTSPSARLQPVEPATVYRGQSPEPPMYYDQKEQIKEESGQYRQQPSNSLSGSPSISFGLTGSNLKGNTVNIQTIDGYDYYQGELNQQGQFHGYGKYQYTKTKHEYHGQFEHGKPHGRGTLYKNVGLTLQPKNNSTNLFIVYEGQWKNGMKNGEGRYYYNSDNHYYQGPWVNDQKDGPMGTYVSPIGKYVGKWKQGRMQGRGQFYVLKTNTKYVGNFQNNEFVNGVITYPNKDEYIGKVKNGLRDDSQGRYQYNRLQEDAEQVRYAGGWKNDMKSDKSGQGKYVVTQLLLHIWTGKS